MTSLLNALVRPEIAPLPVYNAGLSDAAVRARYGVARTIRLGSNENPFGPSPRVAQALTALAAHVGDYPDAHATQLRQALAEGTGMAEERLVFGNGSEELIKLLCEIFLQPGDVVVTQRPVFGLHQIYPEMMGAKVQLLNLTAALGFDVPAWCEALRAGPKLAFLPNPSNPVGCMVDADAMARLLAAAPETTLLVIDEAYYEYARLADGYPDVLAQLATRKGPWMVLRTFSKAWALAGLRVGYGLASSAELAALIDRVRTPFNLNSAAQHAALAAWQDAPHMQRSVVQTVQLREALAQRLQTLAAAGAPLAGLRIAPSVANFLFLDLGRPAAPIAQALLAQGIIVKPWKEDGYTQCLRVSIGQATDNAAFVHALVQAFGQEQA
ncbi:histidinol-phosphate aminotransferase [Lampropedia cohaerens]|uniref:Histidinol-phosphate aminotransferase n=1 Tax=Lampropedia cohaerens TaxID=1610491 RepID=A0A0U1Q1X9_9BURK|nr:histidinol-phosphate transaminase [Lampropedia cohaerens]KKW68595.1 histidinol-phosphate aminotransferase [Lampropedia cohaerens]